MPISSKQRRRLEKLLDRVTGEPDAAEISRRTVRRLEETSETMESITRAISQIPKTDGWEQVTNELVGLKELLGRPKDDLSTKEILAALEGLKPASNEPVVALLTSLLQSLRESRDEDRKIKNLMVGGGNNAFYQDQQTAAAGQFSVAPMGAIFNDALQVLTTGWMGAPRSTGYRAIHVNLRDSSGNEIGPGALATPTVIFNGKQTVATAGTRVQLATTQAVKSISVKALASNTGLIFLGNSTVASGNGFQLSAGDEQSFDLANLATVYIDASVSGEGVTYFAVN